MVISALPGLNTPNRATQKASPSKPSSKTGGRGSDGLNGIYWVGADGNIYTRGNDGQVKNYGKGIGIAQNGFDAANGSSELFRKVDSPDGGPSGESPAGNSGAGAPSGRGGGGGSGISYPDMSGAIKILRENIAGLDPIYGANVENANKAYQTSNNERISRFNSSKAQSDQSNISNDQTVLGSRNAIEKSTRQSADSIQSILGSLGMGGSTANKALSAIADKSNADTNTANYGYGQNKQSILQSWNDYVNQDANQQAQLTDKKNYDIAQAGISRATAKKDYLGQIATNEVNGGIGNGSSVLGDIAGLNTEIGNLSKINNTYTGTTPTYKAPEIGAILGPNQPAYSIATGAPTGTGTGLAPKIVKVNPQDSTNDKYGITA